MSHISETETIVKRLLPYLSRRGYDIDADITFEEPVAAGHTGRKGFIDLLVHCGKKTPSFLIEVKRDGARLKEEHRKQAIDYGVKIKAQLVAVTNGQIFELYNARNGLPLKLNGSPFNRIPHRTDLLKTVVPTLRAAPLTDTIALPTDRGLPFRPGIPLTKLNNLFKQCHNSIRRIEKNEEYAFADFGKFLFLKLLEEKWDTEGDGGPPYTFLFHELAQTPPAQADQVQTAIKSMIDAIRKLKDYGEVLDEPIRLKQASTYLTIVKRLAKVSFNDCDLDAKGTAFEYFVRATLKGKKLGQYFTPRPLVRLMLHLGHWHQIIENLRGSEPFKVLDPACGTGGFLVFAMNSCLQEVDRLLKAKKIHATLANKLRMQLRKEVFYGIDANESVACSAKMNMIVAGDGHTTITFADSLSATQLIPDYKRGDGTADRAAHLILTNPPFGTSESESLSPEARKGYAIQSTKGQALFLQKMIATAGVGSRIVTVIDDGVLNTASYIQLRRHLLEKCRIEAVVQLPDETFKPNKITVRSSVLVLTRRDVDDADLTDEYPATFVRLDSLGYEGSGVEIRGFRLDKLIAEVAALDPYALPKDKFETGYNWSAFACESTNMSAANRHRLDFKYWEPTVVERVRELEAAEGTQTIKELNQIKTRRGDSPPTTEYVSETEGHALVVKSGSNINKYGELVPRGDYIEEAVFEEYEKKGLALKDGDILLASTGEGTLGKCCVFRLKKPAIPEGHVTLIRVNHGEVYPEYLCDYLRKGFGHEQLNRLFTGSTGMVEVTPDDVDRILVPKLPSLKVQQARSAALRKAEAESLDAAKEASHKLRDEVRKFTDISSK